MILITTAYIHYNTEIIIDNGYLLKKFTTTNKIYFKKSLNDITVITQDDFGNKHFNIHHKGGLDQMNFKLFNDLPEELKQYLQQNEQNEVKS